MPQKRILSPEFHQQGYAQGAVMVTQEMKDEVRKRMFSALYMANDLLNDVVGSNTRIEGHRNATAILAIKIYDELKTEGKK